MSRARALLSSAVLLVSGVAGATIAASPATAAPAPAGPRGTAASPFVGAHQHPSGVSPAVLNRARTAAYPVARPTGLQPRAVALRPAGNGTVVVAVTGSRAAVVAAAAAVGGRVLAAADPTSSVQVPKAKLALLAGRAGVTRVDALNRPRLDSVGPGPSQAVPATGADQWQNAGVTGTGQTIAIIDAGFGVTQAEYDTEVAAGHLGPNPLPPFNGDCTDGFGNNTAFDGESHGLAVAEQASQQAPGASIVMYCVNSPSAVALAVAGIENRHIPIVSSSLSWFDDARGDGTGPNGSVADSVADARQHGILWFNSTGNYVPQHWSGGLADVNHDGYLDLGNHDMNTYPYESNFYFLYGGSDAAGNFATFDLQWDQWPTTSHPLRIVAYGTQCTAPYGSGGFDDCQGRDINGGGPLFSSQDPGGKPVVELSTEDFAVDSHTHYDQIWEVYVVLPSGFPAGAHYDLHGLGEFDFGSALSCPQADSQGNCIFAAPALQGSLTSPSNSPYAVGVGAVNTGADGEHTPGALEYFSSQGPTIDRRVKPELASWDGVSSYVPEFSTGFYGTSAAAPNAAGTAVLVRDEYAQSGQAEPDAAQVLRLLEQRANSGVPNTVPSNQIGYGRNTLGEPTITEPAHAKYQSVSPVRIYDERQHSPSQLGGGKTITVPVPGLPSDATAVAINLTGAGARGDTFLSAYPGSQWPGTSNLNLSSLDPTAAVFAIVTVGALHTITVRNNLAPVSVIVDLLGYFGTGSESGGYSGQAPVRAIDTGKTRLVPGGSRTIVHVTAPAGTAAAIVNMTAANASSGGYLNAGPSSCPSGSSTVNYVAARARANLAVVPLDSAGNFCVRNSSGVRIVADVVGLISPGAGAAYVTLPAPTRIVDTRYGNGNSGSSRAPSPLGGASTRGYHGAGVGVVPTDAVGLATSVVEASATASGYVSVAPGFAPPAPKTSNLNFVAGEIVPNAVLTGLSGNDFALYNYAGSTQCAVDLFGYFE